MIPQYYCTYHLEQNIVELEKKTPKNETGIMMMSLYEVESIEVTQKKYCGTVNLSCTIIAHAHYSSSGLACLA